MTSLAELYLPEAIRSSMNWPSCTGNEMLSVVRVAILFLNHYPCHTIDAYPRYAYRSQFCRQYL